MSSEPESAISWRAIRAHSPVIASDGVKVGAVTEVAALPKEDIFHGVVFAHQQIGHNFLVPAADIDKLTERAVYIKSTSQAAERYERFHELHVERLGLTGLFHWKHLGWKDSSE